MVLMPDLGLMSKWMPYVAWYLQIRHPVVTANKDKLPSKHYLYGLTSTKRLRRIQPSYRRY